MIKSIKKLSVLVLFFSLIFTTTLTGTVFSDVLLGTRVNISNDAVSSQNPSVAASGNDVYLGWTKDTGSNSEIYFKASTDNGVTFGSSIDLSNTAGKTSGSPKITADSSHVYAVWTDATSGLTEVYFTRSTDSQATSFDTNTKISTSPSGSSALTPQIAASGSKVFVVWQNSSSTDEVYFRNSTDNGVSFNSGFRLSDNSGGAELPQIAVSGTNTYVVWHDYNHNDIIFRKSPATDTSKTFESQINLGSSGTSVSGHPQIAASGSNVYVVWEKDNAGDIYYTRSTDSGATFSAATDLSNTASFSTYPRVAVSGSNVYVVWQDGGSILLKTSTDSGATFGSAVTLGSTESTLGTGGMPQLTATGNNVIATWEDAKLNDNGDVFLSASADNGVTFCGTHNLSQHTGTYTSGSVPATTPQIISSSSNVYASWANDTGTKSEILFTPSTTTSSCAQFDTTTYKLSDTATVTVTDTTLNLDAAAMDHPTITAKSTSDTSGISMTLTETGVNTHVFTGSLHFTTGTSNAASNTLHASAGDAITITTSSGQTATASIYSRTISFVNISTGNTVTSYTLNDKEKVKVTDPNSNTDSSTAETITLTVKSNTNTAGVSLVLKETGVNTGVFEKDMLIPVTSDNEFSTGRSLTISQDETNGHQDTNGVIDTLTTLTISSDSDPSGFSPVLTETGSNTGIFTAKLKFSDAATSSASNAILVHGGDVLMSVYNSATTFGLILPNTNSSVNIILVNVGSTTDTVTATYQGTSASVTVGPGSGGGGGGGGLVRPGLVLDVLAAVGGSASVAPSFSLDSLAATEGNLPENIRQQVLYQDPNKPLEAQHDNFDYPLVIDGGGYVLGRYSNKIDTVTEKTNTPVDLKLNVPATNLQHLALYTNLHGTENDLTKSDTYIIYDKDSPLTIVDPHHYFDHVKFDLTTQGIKNKIDYSITFANPMEKSNIVLRTWNDKHSSSDAVILDAWQVTDSQKLTSSSELSPLKETQIPIPQPNPSAESPSESKVPSWVKNNVKLWNAGSIGDTEFETGIQYLISEKIIQIQKQTVEPSGTDTIPKWVKNTAGFWANGDVTEDEFLHGIEYLVKLGLIKVH